MNMKIPRFHLAIVTVKWSFQDPIHGGTLGRISPYIGLA